jgi:hypothetical protein
MVRWPGQPAAIVAPVAPGGERYGALRPTRKAGVTGRGRPDVRPEPPLRAGPAVGDRPLARTAVGHPVNGPPHPRRHGRRRRRPPPPTVAASPATCSCAGTTAPPSTRPGRARPSPVRTPSPPGPSCAASPSSAGRCDVDLDGGPRRRRPDPPAGHTVAGRGGPPGGEHLDGAPPGPLRTARRQPPTRPACTPGTPPQPRSPPRRSTPPSTRPPSTRPPSCPSTGTGPTSAARRSPPGRRASPGASTGVAPGADGRNVDAFHPRNQPRHHALDAVVDLRLLGRVPGLRAARRRRRRPPLHAQRRRRRPGRRPPRRARTAHRRRPGPSEVDRGDRQRRSRRPPPAARPRRCRAPRRLPLCAPPNKTLRPADQDSAPRRPRLCAPPTKTLRPAGCHRRPSPGSGRQPATGE